MMQEGVIEPPQMYANMGADEDWMTCYADSADDGSSSGHEMTGGEIARWEVAMMEDQPHFHGTPDSQSVVSEDSDVPSVWPTVEGIDWDSSSSSNSPVADGGGFVPYPKAPTVIGDGNTGGCAAPIPVTNRGAKRSRAPCAAVATAVAAAPAGSLLESALAWVEETNLQGHSLRKAMPPEYAELLLREPSFCPGPRPAIFSLEQGQWIFKESIETENQNGDVRRTMSRDASAPASDRWHNSGGAKNSRDLPAENPQVRRRYGAVEPRHVPGRGFVYHEYVLLNHGAAQPGDKVPDDRRVMLYHVMPKRAVSGARKDPSAAVALATVQPSVAVEAPPPPPPPPANPQHQQHRQQAVPPHPKTSPQVHQRQKSGSKAKRSRTKAPQKEPLLPPRPPKPAQAQMAVSGAPSVDMEMEMVEINRDVESVRLGAPIMTLRAPAGPQSAEFIRFEKANKWLGSIKEDGRGLTLSSAGGDIAEWHRVADKPGKPGVSATFGEGDLVGIVSGQLTRITKGADMLGVITRKAMVAGSQPEDEDLDRYDTVAYVGRVPVRVIGTATSGDRIGPSGREDGTAVVVPNGVPFVGTVLRGDNETKERFVEISVATPGATTRDTSGCYLSGARWFALKVAIVAAAVVAGICVALYFLNLHTESPEHRPDGLDVPKPLKCTPQNFMRARQMCDKDFSNAASFADCGAECTRLADGLIDNCGLNLMKWPTVPGKFRADSTTAQNDTEVYTTTLRAMMMVQANDVDPQLSPLSGGICYLGAGKSCYAVFNASVLRGHQVVTLQLLVAKYAATGFDAPYDNIGTVKARSPEQYSRDGDDLSISLASSDWVHDYSVQPTNGRLLTRADDVGESARPLFDLPVDVIDLSSSDLFVIHFNSTSEIERRYAGVGLPERWERQSMPRLFVALDPMNPDKYAESEALIHNGWVLNGFMAALCITDDISASLGVQGAQQGQSRLNDVLDGPSSCPGLYRGMSKEQLGTVEQTQCPELGEGVSWPACCAGGSYDSCAFAPAEDSSSAELCAACPVGSSSDPSTYQCYAMPEDVDECTAALNGMRWCREPISDMVQRKCDPEDGLPGCFEAVLRVAELAQSGSCVGARDRRAGSDMVFPSNRDMLVLMSICTGGGLFLDVDVNGTGV